MRLSLNSLSDEGKHCGKTSALCLLVIILPGQVKVESYRFGDVLVPLSVFIFLKHSTFTDVGLYSVYFIEISHVEQFILPMGWSIIENFCLASFFKKMN